MLLGNVMWKIFRNTGHIEAYLIYRSCYAPGDNQPILAQLQIYDQIK